MTLQVESPASLSLQDLISSLALVPPGVIPAGIMREIMSRGPEANRLLLSRVDRSIENVGNGIGSVPSETFFCYALLGAHPETCMLPTLERLFLLESHVSDEVVGDLKGDFSVNLVASMANTNNIDSVFQWIDNFIQNCHWAL